MSTSDPIRAVLFDIDGTLIDARGAGRAAFIQALEKSLGLNDDIEYIDFAGATDLGVIQKILDRNNMVAPPGHEEAFFKQLFLEMEKAFLTQPGSHYPGAPELVKTLAGDSRMRLGLITGNARSTAFLKLKQAGLDGYFLYGGYGDQHHDRAEIAQIACAGLTDTLDEGQPVERRFVIGDTPADIRAARGIGAVAITVATGKFRVDDLKSAGADYVLEDLSDTDGVLKILNG